MAEMAHDCFMNLSRKLKQIKQYLRYSDIVLLRDGTDSIPSCLCVLSRESGCQGYITCMSSHVRSPTVHTFLHQKWLNHQQTMNTAANPFQQPTSLQWVKTISCTATPVPVA